MFKILKKFISRSNTTEVIIITKSGFTVGALKWHNKENIKELSQFVGVCLSIAIAVTTQPFDKEKAVF